MRAAPSVAAAQSSPWVKMINGGETTGCLEVRTCFCGQEERYFPRQGGEAILWVVQPTASGGEPMPGARDPCKPLSHPLAALSKHSHKNRSVCPLHTKTELMSLSELFTLGSVFANIKKLLLWETSFLFFPDAVPDGSAQALLRRASWGLVLLLPVPKKLKERGRGRGGLRRGAQSMVSSFSLCMQGTHTMDSTGPLHGKRVLCHRHLHHLSLS